MNDWICTTVLEYADRAEGQILHRGTKEACEKVGELISAVSIGGDVEVPRASRVMVLEAQRLDLQAGELWRCKRPTPDAELAARVVEAGNKHEA